MIDKNLNIVFWGTPDFAAIILNNLILNSYKPTLIITAPDKPVGRKKIITPSPVKEIAIKNQIHFFQPEKIKDNSELFNQLKEIKPDLFIVAAYGLILSQDILDLPKFKAINVHPSLLPKYRGPSPIQAAILNGDQQTGISIMLMDMLMDHGPIIINEQLPIINNETTETLSKKLAELGAKLIIKTIPQWINGEIKAQSQDHDRATFTKIITKNDGHIDWRNTAAEIERLIRAYQPWPIAYSLIKSVSKKIDQKKIKILKVNIIEEKHNLPPGTLIMTENKKIAVTTDQNLLELINVQLEGKKIMTIKEVFNGHPEIIGSLFI